MQYEYILYEYCTCFTRSPLQTIVINHHTIHTRTSTYCIYGYTTVKNTIKELKTKVNYLK